MSRPIPRTYHYIRNFRYRNLCLPPPTPKKTILRAGLKVAANSADEEDVRVTSRQKNYLVEAVFL